MPKLIGSLPPERAKEAAALLRDAYWNSNVPEDVIIRAHLGSSAWVGALDDEDRLVGTARSLSDGSKLALVFDVMVAPAWRGRGLGEALVRLLLDQPAVRGARRVWLGTRDAQAFYAKLGFAEERILPRRSYPTTEMVLTREI